MDGFGEVEPEHDEPVFHAPWEGRVLAMDRAMGFAGAWNIDMSRSARERLAPHVYLTSSYYRRWALAMETNIIERGIASSDELAAGQALRAGKSPQRKLTPETVDAAFKRGSYERVSDTRPQFRPGNRVRARNIHPNAHTRLPRYVRGHVGAIDLVHGCHAFPDVAVFGLEEDPQWLYTVKFGGQELWGDDADPMVTVSVDAFEPYLELA